MFVYKSEEKIKMLKFYILRERMAFKTNGLRSIKCIDVRRSSIKCTNKCVKTIEIGCCFSWLLQYSCRHTDDTNFERFLR